MFMKWELLLCICTNNKYPFGRRINELYKMNQKKKNLVETRIFFKLDFLQLDLTFRIYC